MRINLLEEHVIDWRGTRIVPGAVVLYHAPYGRAGITVEGVVRDEWTTPSGWIKLRTLRGSNHRIAVSNVGVRPERITVTTPAPAPDA